MIEEDVVKLLLDKSLVISTAESCTGGMIASRIVNVSGASQVFEEGYITYSNSAKNKLLGVRAETFEKYTAVSRECAAQMAVGCLERSDSDIAVSVTGYAGPFDSEKEPKGLVYIGCAYSDTVKVEEFKFNGNRMEIRESAATAALNLIYKIVLNEL